MKSCIFTEQEKKQDTDSVYKKCQNVCLIIKNLYIKLTGQVAPKLSASGLQRHD